VINLLDTPGHQDFSEDTYRVLTAVDAALMVIDAANGRRGAGRCVCSKCCRARGTPILTFVNKMDREVREPLALIDEIERYAWPVARALHLARRHGKALPWSVRHPAATALRVFRPGEDRVGDDDELIEGLGNPLSASRFGSEFEQAQRDIELVKSASPEFGRAGISRGEADAGISSASAVNNFRRREVGTRSWILRRRRARKPPCKRWWSRRELKFSGVVFKIQAKMDRRTATALRSCASARAASSAACA